jgi:large conductance mechanosensitive channel
VIKDFKDFALRGNTLDVAMAFVLGAAFTAVVSSFIDNVVMNLVAAVVGRPDFNNLTFHLGQGVIRYGAFLTRLTTFALLALTLFLLVRAIRRAVPARVSRRDCPSCLSSIPLEAKACAFCTRDVPAAT